MVLTEDAYNHLLESVAPYRRRALANELVYIRNMSCVEGPHPAFERCRRRAWRNYGIDISLQHFKTSVWSYGRLARSLDFCGCELLLIDAEGHDAKILRSMMDHCHEEARGRCAWPDIVVFESAGHCDFKEGAEAEADVVKQLEARGYFVILVCNIDTFMVRREAMNASVRLKAWVDKVTCDKCWSV